MTSHGLTFCDAARSDIATGVTGPRSRTSLKMSLPAYRSTRRVR
jgi:hypothetical protein